MRTGPRMGCIACSQDLLVITKADPTEFVTTFCTYNRQRKTCIERGKTHMSYGRTHRFSECSSRIQGQGTSW